MGSFQEKNALLRLGTGQAFHGEATLAVTKALLQSGVSYIGGYRGAAPHLPDVLDVLDVLGDAGALVDELGVHVAAAANEAGAAAMLAASINYPLRGAVTWQSIAGTNRASDALSHVASSGVKGGALVMVADDYGEDTSGIQERSHAIAMKSQIWLLDPRPNLPAIVEMVAKGLQLSEASNTPVMLALRRRAWHMHGSFACKDNRAPKFSRKNRVQKAAGNASATALPPALAQEKHKIEARLPAALKFIRAQHLNEFFDGDNREIGIVLQGGLYNTVLRALQELGLADAFGASPIPLYVLNVTYPLVPEELTRFCSGKRAVLVVEEGQPGHIEEAINAILRRADMNDTYLIGKEVLPVAGQYTGEAVLGGIAHFLQLTVPDGVDPWKVVKVRDSINARKKNAADLLSLPVPARPPGFCVGCPERPVFSALKLLQKEVGPLHISADVGCHALSALPPFSMGSAVVGHGLSLAGSASVAPLLAQRVISVMDDGGLWHQGLTTSIANALARNDDGVLIILKSGLSATVGGGARGPVGIDLQELLHVLGVTWLRTVRSGGVGDMLAALREALNTPLTGLKIIIADGQCQLERQRRLPAEAAGKRALKQPVTRTRFGIDADMCSGDRSCIRLSGCPSLTLKENSDPLRDAPVTTVDDSCVGCGTCGELAHAATLCPAFYKAEITQNGNLFDRLLARMRGAIIGSLQATSMRGIS